MKKLMSLLILISSLAFSTVTFAQNPDGVKVNPEDKSDRPVQGGAFANAECKDGACLQNMTDSQIIGDAGLVSVSPNRYDQFLPGNAAPAESAQPAKGSKGTD